MAGCVYQNDGTASSSAEITNGPTANAYTWNDFNYYSCVHRLPCGMCMIMNRECLKSNYPYTITTSTNGNVTATTEGK